VPEVKLIRRIMPYWRRFADVEEIVEEVFAHVWASCTLRRIARSGCCLDADPWRAIDELRAKTDAGAAHRSSKRRGAA
jgi:hypothetical protein